MIGGTDREKAKPFGREKTQADANYESADMADSLPACLSGCTSSWHDPIPGLNIEHAVKGIDVIQ